MSESIAANETNRLQALYDYQILDTPQEACFDDLLEIAATVCGSPYAAISFIDSQRQWFKSKIGMQMSETPREVAFCSHTILYSDLFLVKDAREDERFASNPLVAGPPQVRFYAGMPITTSDGFNLGTICVLDTVPRDITAHQKKTLESLARQVLAQCDLKRNKIALAGSQNELALAFSGLIRAHTNSISQQEMLDASEKMSTLGEMSSSIIHEINNPLTILHARASMLKKLVMSDSLNKEKLLDSCALIEKNIFRISGIIKAMQSVSRNSDGDPYTPTKLKTILEDVLQLCEKRLMYKGTQLKVSQISEEITLECREGQIAQVLINLLNNAADAITSLEEQWIALDFNEKPSCIEITVTDSGRGIPMDVREKIFQPFYTTKTVGSGTGLGLSISRRIIESHHGSIKINTDCSNTQFVITLPKKHMSNKHLDSSRLS